jgi:hypothetical protein
MKLGSELLKVIYKMGSELLSILTVADGEVF